MKRLILLLVGLLIVGNVWGQQSSTTCVAPEAFINPLDSPNTSIAQVGIKDFTEGDYLPQWRKEGGVWQNGDLFYLRNTYSLSFYTQTNLEPGNRYEVRFQQWCANGLKSEFSAPVSFSTTTNCRTPDNLFYYASRLHWRILQGGSSVVEWRKFGQSGWTASPVLNESSTDIYRNYILLNQPSGLYEWRVKAVCPDGLSSDYTYGSTFNYDDCSQVATNPEGQVFDIQVTTAKLTGNFPCEGSTIDIRWRKQSETYWNIACATDSSYIQGGFPNSSSYYVSLTGLLGQTGYEYQISHYRAGQSPLHSPVYSFTTQAPVITYPVVACVGATGAELLWALNEKAETPTNYDLQYRPRGTLNWTTTSLVSLTGGSYRLTNLMINTAYEWRIRVNGLVPSDYSPILIFTTVCMQPTITDASRSSEATFCSRMRVRWLGCSDTGSRFTIRYRLKGATMWAASLDAGTLPYYDFTTLTPGFTYEMQVLAYCAGSITPITSDVAELSINCPCLYLLDPLTKNITAQSATLSWYTSVYSYGTSPSPTELRWRPAGSTTWNILIVSASLQQYNMRGLTDQTTYEWQVRAVCDAANAFTPIQVFRTICNVPFSTRTKCLTSSSALLTWKNAGGRTSYTIDWRPVGSGTWTTVSSLTTSSYELVGLMANTAYEWRIRTACGTTANSPNSPTIIFHTNTCSDRISSIQAGLWSDPATWSCGRVPAMDDVVTIAHPVTMSANSTGQARKLAYLRAGRLIYGARARLQMQSR